MKNTLITFIFLLSIPSFAQLGVISGQIKSETNEVLPGASVVLIGTVRGVESNTNGQYIQIGRAHV